MILLVEGLTDAVFFQQMLLKLHLINAELEYDHQPGRRNIPTLIRGNHHSHGTLVEVEFRNQEGKANIPEAVRGLLASGVLELAVAKDIDGGTPEQVVQSIGNLVHDFLRMPKPGNQQYSRKIEVQDRTVYVIPMGLHADAALAELGVAQHEMEDYLIKLLLEDSNLRKECPELQPLLSEILPRIRSRNGPFNSSKDLFQLIKPVIKHGFSDTSAVRSIFEHGDISILHSTMAPLLGAVETALRF